MSKVNIIIKRPNDLRGHFATVSANYETLSKIVGGDLEAITIHKEVIPEEFNAEGDLIILCHDSGRILGLPYNCTLFGYSFVGTIILIGCAGDDFADVPIGWPDWRNYMLKVAGL